MRRFKARRRQVAEIYFVLYLAALMFLLPGKQELGSGSGDRDNTRLLSSIFQQAFTLQPEKTALVCRYTIDSLGIRIITFDSVNTILATGNVRNIRYDVEVEDPTARHRIRLAMNGSEENSFEMKSADGGKTVLFSWKPLLRERPNRTLIVRLRAFADPDFEKLAPDISEMAKVAGTVLTASAQFTLNLNLQADLGDGLLAQTSPGVIRETLFREQVFVNPNATGTTLPATTNVDFSMQSQSDQVRTIPFQLWQNKVFFSGILSPGELAETPQVMVESSGQDRSGTAKIQGFFGNELRLGGIAPGSQSMRVRVTARRRSDDKVQSLTFEVRTQPVDPPRVPNLLYPETEYTFKPNLPELSGSETRAILRFGKTELVASIQGTDFLYKPAIEDTGKTLYFERFIEGKQVGQSIPVRIEDYPPPDMLVETVGNGYIKITTRSWGKFKGRDNRAWIEVEGNAARPKELAGNFRREESSAAMSQEFEIRPSDKGQPFVFRYRIVDQRGRSTAFKSLRGN